MARPQQFKQADVLNSAMRLFWAHGYVATGMSQLLQTTGLKPGSFYNAFASKKTLFIRVLEHYNEQVVGTRIARYLEHKQPLNAIEEFFLSSFEPLPESKMLGCLLTNTSTEIGRSDADINAVVWAGMRQIESAFKRCIVDAQQKALLAPELDANATALHLLGCYQGMTVIARLTQDKSRLRSLTESALQGLQSPEP